MNKPAMIAALQIWIAAATEDFMRAGSLAARNAALAERRSCLTQLRALGAVA